MVDHPKKYRAEDIDIIVRKHIDVQLDEKQANGGLTARTEDSRHYYSINMLSGLGVDTDRLARDVQAEFGLQKRMPLRSRDSLGDAVTKVTHALKKEGLLKEEKVESPGRIRQRGFFDRDI